MNTIAFRRARFLVVPAVIAFAVSVAAPANASVIPERQASYITSATASSTTSCSSIATGPIDLTVDTAPLAPRKQFNPLFARPM